MPNFSKSSKEKLATCHPDLQRLFNEVIKGYDCKVLCGNRTDEEQTKVYNDGKSTLKAGKSKHNQLPALAVDVAPYPIEWKNKAKFYHFVGYVKRTAEELKIPVRFGADWNGNNNLKDQTFFDLPHFELKVNKD